MLLEVLVGGFQSDQDFGRRFEKGLRLRIGHLADIFTQVVGQRIEHAFDLRGVVAGIGFVFTNR